MRIDMREKLIEHAIVVPDKTKVTDRDIMKLKSVPNHIISKICELICTNEITLFGSMVLGGYSRSSDIDIVTPIKSATKLLPILKEGEYTYRESDNPKEWAECIFFRTDEQIYNIIVCLNDTIYNQFRNAIHSSEAVLQACPDMYEICEKNKDARIHLFQSMLKLSKMKPEYKLSPVS